MSEEDKKPEESKEEEYEEGGEDETPKEEESTATFAPVVRAPLFPLQERQSFRHFPGNILILTTLYVSIYPFIHRRFNWK